MVDVVFLPLVRHLDDLLKFVVTLVWHCSTIAIEEISVDVPKLLWVIFEEAFFHQLIEADEILSEHGILFPQAICASESWDVVLLVRFVDQVSISVD